MNIERIIEELRAERDRLSGIIIALERLDGNEDGSNSPKRRGRKFMDKEGRQEVSERMKRYWADRRSTRTAKKKEHADGGAASKSGEKTETAKSSDSTQVIAA